MSITYDLNQAEPVPEGHYRVKCTKCTETRSKFGGDAQLDITWTVMDGEREGTEIRQWITFGSSSKSAQRIARYAKVLGITPDAENHVTWVPSKVVGAHARIEVEHRKSQDGDIFAKVKNIEEDDLPF